MGATSAAAVIAANKQDRSNTIFFGHQVSPYIQAWAFDAVLGFGAKYADISSGGPGAQVGRSLFMNTARNAIALSSNGGTTPFIQVRLWNPSLGWGTKYADPTSSSATATDGGADFSLRDDLLIMSSGTSPYLTGWPWSNSTGFGTKFTNPAAVTSTNRGNCFGKSGFTVFAGGAGNVPNAYRISSAGFGTKYTNGASAGLTNLTGVNVHPSNKAMIFCGDTGNPSAAAYPWTEGTGFGTKYTNPGVSFTANNGAISNFTKAGSKAVITNNGTAPYVNVFPFSLSGGFGTRYTNPSSGGVIAIGSSISSDDLAVALSGNNSPYIIIHPLLQAGIGTKFANPTTLPPGNSLSASFN
jgi:hypothetical protein